MEKEIVVVESIDRIMDGNPGFICACTKEYAKENYSFTDNEETDDQNEAYIYSL